VAGAVARRVQILLQRVLRRVRRWGVTGSAADKAPRATNRDEVHGGLISSLNALLAHCAPGRVETKKRSTTLSLLWFLIIGLIAGFLAGKIMNGSGYGLIGDLVIGIVGAFIGGWVFGLLGIAIGGLVGSLVAALVGALLLIFIVRMIKRA
jgi:uncharacterized membrane protein YeaQ/YmgE (transglycosylase-associated protein family)